jgi:hypothetical protein
VGGRGGGGRGFSLRAEPGRAARLPLLPLQRANHTSTAAARRRPLPPPPPLQQRVALPSPRGFPRPPRPRPLDQRRAQPPGTAAAAAGAPRSPAAPPGPRPSVGPLPRPAAAAATAPHLAGDVPQVPVGRRHLQRRLRLGALGGPFAQDRGCAALGLREGAGFGGAAGGWLVPAGRTDAGAATAAPQRQARAPQRQARAPPHLGRRDVLGEVNRKGIEAPAASGDLRARSEGGGVAQIGLRRAARARAAGAAAPTGRRRLPGTLLPALRTWTAFLAA